MNSKTSQNANYVCELVDLLSGSYQPPLLPDDTSGAILAEYSADAAVLDDDYAVALSTYKSLKTTVRRVRYKMAWCLIAQGQFAEAVPLLRDAAKSGDPTIMTLKCVALRDSEKNSRSSVSSTTREEIRQLLRSALSLPNLSRNTFYLADEFIIEPNERAAHIAAAFALYPEEPVFRQNYLRLAVRESVVDPAILKTIAISAFEREYPSAGDYWAALKVARFCKDAEWLASILEALKEKFGNAPTWKLFAGDAALEQNDPLRAKLYFEECLHIVVDDRSAQASREIAWSLRGLIHATALLNEDAEFLNYSIRYADRYRQGKFEAGWSWLHDDGEGVLSANWLPIPLEDEIFGEDAYTDLCEFREALLSGEMPSATRGIYRALFLPRDWGRLSALADGSPEYLASQERIFREVETLLTETNDPAVGAIVGQLQLKKGEAQAASESISAYAFAFYDVFGEMPATLADMSLDDEQRGHVLEFVAGVQEYLEHLLLVDAEKVAICGYDFLNILLREVLFKQRLYNEFSVLLDLVFQSAQRSGLNYLDSRYWFDAGLAHHFLDRFAQAEPCYRSCLELDPDHQAASSNLNLLLSPEAKKREILLTYIHGLTKQTPPASIDEMSLENAVYLVALYRACGELGQDQVLEPFSESEYPFAPTSDLMRPLFELLSFGLVKVSSQTGTDAFSFDLENRKVLTMQMSKFYWEIPAHSLQLLKAVESAAITQDWPTSWRSEAPALAMSLAKGECLEYLEYAATSRHFVAQGSEKPRLIFENLLHHFSVSQCYALIYRAGRSAADYYQRVGMAQGMTRTHAGNNLVRSLQMMGDRAQAENWDVAGYSRIRECPRTILSYVLHDTFLRTGERGFKEAIHALFKEKDDSVEC